MASVARAAPVGAEVGRELLNPDDLASRWRGSISKKTLSNWRQTGLGPPYLKIGSRILYPLHGVIDYEGKRGYGSTLEYGKDKEGRK